MFCFLLFTSLSYVPEMNTVLKFLPMLLLRLYTERYDSIISLFVEVEALCKRLGRLDLPETGAMCSWYLGTEVTDWAVVKSILSVE